MATAVNERVALVAEPQAPATLARAAALANAAWAFHQGLRGYTATPLRALGSLAGKWQLGSVVVKDESHRFGLNAFKVLGASFAMHHWLATHDAPAETVFTTATDGNHGRAVAWMARQLGYRAVIFMPAHSVRARIDAILNEGAQVVLVDEGYDAAVQLALQAAATRGWIVVQDTATADYHDVPELVAAGYWTMARELEPATHAPELPSIDVVMLHAGVGTWAAAMAQYYWHRYGARRPRLVVVEPTAAACLLDSVRSGEPTPASGSLRTIMAGLNCGFPSLDALAILRSSVDAFIAIPDQWAERAMRCLATPSGSDAVVVAGESGAAGVAGLMALMEDPAYAGVRDHVGLGPGSRVLAWCTEGATDPAGWERVVGRPVPA